MELRSFLIDDILHLRVLRPGGTYDSSPAIYRRVRYYAGLRPGGTPEYRPLIAKAEGPPLLN
jgi:hypothetical protein